MPKRWMIASHWPEREQAAQRLGVSPLVAQLLFNRGLTDREEAHTFLNPQLKTLAEPDALPGAVKAANLIADKVRQHKPIVIYGDYDVDGITGTAILWHILTLAGADVSYYIPHRLEEGYGLNAEALQQLRTDGTDTIITVDCGISAVEPARVARDIGLTLIITDHHTAGDTMPKADAIVHPRIADGYPNPDLCGAGVAFKLAWAIARTLTGSQRVSEQFRDFLVDATGLVALGTIADVVPLVGENRVLAKFGLMGLAESKLNGLTTLIEAAQLNDQRLSSEHVGFWLAPRLNAAGRMGHARLAAELLTQADEARAREIAVYLEEQNRKRRSVQRRIVKEACEKIDENNLASDARRAIVLASHDWHAGVIGIVASRIVERYHRPTVLIAIENSQGQGSARSIRHFALHQAMADCSEHLIGFGGHAMAAGLRIAPDNIDAFTEAFVARANQILTAKDLEPKLRLDAEVPLSFINTSLIRELEQLAPFGQDNPKPRFASPMLELEGEPRTVGKTGEHLTCCLTDGKVRLRAIAFGQKVHLPALLEHRRCRVAFEPVLNTFNGRTNVELKILDFEFPGE